MGPYVVRFLRCTRWQARALRGMFHFPKPTLALAPPALGTPTLLGLPYDGTRPALEGRTLHVFSVGASAVKLLESPHAATPRSHPGPYPSAEGIRWLTLDVADLTSTVHRCRDSGARFQLEPTEIRAGLRVAIVEDPDGNAVELVERR